jgi:phenylalanyl-tRNA synthetase beta chain
MLGSGLDEVWTFSLTSPEAMAKGAMAADRAAIGAVELQNPLSEEFSVMRWSMLPSMLEVVGRNLSVGATAVRIFELGRTYARLNSAATDTAAAEAGRLRTGRTATELPIPATEERTLAGALTGPELSSTWNLPSPPEDALFFEGKGIVELLLTTLRIDGVVWEPCDEPVFEAGRAGRASRDGQVFCVLGEVAAAVRDRYDIRCELVVFELNLGWLLECADTARVYQPLPRQPAALRDLALAAEDAVPAARIEATIRAAAGPWLESLALFDVYRGKGLAAGTRSLGYNLRFRHPERTLTDGEVDSLVAAVIEAVGREHGARLRE